MSSNLNIFDYIFKNNIWGDSESKSGYASNFKNTQSIRAFLPEFIEKYKIKSILDAPCGDMYWFSLMNIKNVKYYGFDIVDDIIKINREKFKENRNYKFETKNLITDELPKVDLIFCRDLIIHFPISTVYELINNFVKTKSKYLMITQHILKNNSHVMNADINLGQFAFRSLVEPPFNFPNPKMLIPEDWDDKSIMRCLALYDLKTLESFLSDSVKN
ncbi:methyltransferase domain-containing protein [bacterium]|nr:methyltransferase domain-containing protein [bacterium]